MSELITAKECTLAELLRSGNFAVPIHQRYYDWEGEHVDTLLFDLAEAVNEGNPCHFLGSIMLIKKNTKNNWEINDGQQRIITFSLICAYLCRFFHDKGHSSEENKTLRVLFDIKEGHNETLNNADSLTPRIIPPRNNKINFNNLIRGHNVGENGKMANAWKRISLFFDDSKRQNIDWRKKTLDYLLNKFIVIRLEVGKDLDPNAIFETLNYRGKHLEQVDLVKNYFLSFFNSDSRSAQCDTMHDCFETIYESFNPKRVSEYVRCYMQAKYGFIKKERFFREIKNLFGSPNHGNSQEIFSLVTGLAEKGNIQIFKTFLRKSANQDVLQKLTRDAKKTNNKRKIEDYLLDLYDYTIVHPIVFALFYHYSKSTKDKKMSAQLVYDCTKILASFFQRVSHIGNFKPSIYEENLANLAKNIFTQKCVTSQQFFGSLKQYDSAGIITDEHYIEQMRTKSYPKKSITKFRYILERVVEHQESGVRIDDKQISIEHILPKSKIHHSENGYWTSEFSTDELDRFPHMLGNLTLLSKKDNSPKSNFNESFSAKKTVYKKSSYTLTRDICESEKWTPREIEKRQHKIAKIAAKQIWNFSI